MVQMSFEYVKLLQRDSFDKWRKLDDLRKEVQACFKCPNLVYSRQLYPYGKPTFGFGNPNSPLFFIGEAPGKWGCGTTGIPFTKDRSGNYFIKILKEVLGMSHQDIWITNCVKCCPEDNRTPTDEERNNCFPYLARELNIIQPFVIVPLGLSATRSILPRTNEFKTVNGREQTFKEVTIPGFVPEHGGLILPLWHPAFVMRELKREKFYKDCFKRVQNCLLDGIKWYGEKL